MTVRRMLPSARRLDAVQVVVHDVNDHGYSRIVELEAFDS
ncbi:hypothetical protein Kfla_4568 [Kribbella flavida DSM 17836]|uniref:Uncharacterized protein n=1 Tax=Kribbella flavida (strain DSM 17836 / JCM 10339 / NBRC 14399) TaxID=479435 RepID=D2PXY0_KRIFD|nr:hypothetical protein Kfla_4568 [Kribbella flavida DSM 17836]